MKRTSARAPGKVILFGEHSVVYGRPALAVPLDGMEAEATIIDGLPGSGIIIYARDLGLTLSLRETPDHPLVRSALEVLVQLDEQEPNAAIEIHSSIPVASGLGSGAAVSAALARALSLYLGKPLSNEALSRIVFDIEKLHHGTPSGIDNTVICFGQPLYFIRDKVNQRFKIAQAIHLLIGDTGIKTPTHIPVGQVHKRWEDDREHFERIFDDIAHVVEEARTALTTGDIGQAGALMVRNQTLLDALGVSCSELDRLIDAAMRAGAHGAKLSGGGQGGNMIALVDEQSIEPVTRALAGNGAAAIYATVVH